MAGQRGRTVVIVALVGVLGAATSGFGANAVAAVPPAVSSAPPAVSSAPPAVSSAPPAVGAVPAVGNVVAVPAVGAFDSGVFWLMPGPEPSRTATIDRTSVVPESDLTEQIGRALPTPTTAPTTTPPPTTAPPVDARSPVERRGDAALAAIAYPWRDRLPTWTIRFASARSGAYGYTYVDRQEIEIFVRADQSDTHLRHVVAHELGHAVDVTLNTSEERAQWQSARGIGGSPWWPGNGASDFSTGAGDFAESFAAWQVGDEHYRSNLGPPPTAEQIALLAALAG